MKLQSYAWMVLVILLCPDTVFGERYICSTDIPFDKMQHPEDPSIIYIAQPVFLELNNGQLHTIEWIEFSLMGGRPVFDKERKAALCEKSFGNKKKKCWIDQMAAEKDGFSTPTNFYYRILEVGIRPMSKVDELEDAIKAGEFIFMYESFVRMNFLYENPTHFITKKRFAPLICN